MPFRLLAVLPILLTGCNDPAGGGDVGTLLIPVQRGEPSSASVRVDSVDAEVRRAADSSLAVEAGAPMPPGTDTLSLSIPVPMAGEVDSFALTVRLRSAGAVVFQTRSTVSVRRGLEVAVPPVVPATWQAHAAAGPGPRLSTAAVLAPELGGVVLMGGLTEGGNDGRTWRFDGSTWTELTGVGSPGGRNGHAMAWDPDRNEVVLFGGRVFGVAPFDDTWVFDGTAWTERQPASRPDGRTTHAMAYDARRGRVLLFGGAGVQGSLGDTWVWDGTTWAFVIGNQGPVARSGHTMVWDPFRQRVVLFGGSNPDGVRSDLWEWDGARWQARTAVGDPPGRREHGAGWDAARGRLVIVGGQDRGVSRGDVWELVDDRWFPVEHADAPDARFGTILVPLESGGLVLFGGRNIDFLGDTWRYR